MAWVEYGESPLPEVGFYVVTDGAEVWVQYRDEFGWAAPEWLRGEDYQQVCEHLEEEILWVWQGQPLELPEAP